MPATGNITSKTVTIPSGGSLSLEVDVEGLSLVGIIMSAGWDAAGLSFQAADVTGGTFRDIHDDAAVELTLSAAAARAIGLGVKGDVIKDFRFIKVRSGTSGVPVNQTADRVLTLLLKG